MLACVVDMFGVVCVCVRFMFCVKGCGLFVCVRFVVVCLGVCVCLGCFVCVFGVGVCASYFCVCLLLLCCLLVLLLVVDVACIDLLICLLLFVCVRRFNWLCFKGCVVFVWFRVAVVCVFVVFVWGNMFV